MEFSSVDRRRLSLEGDGLMASVGLFAGNFAVRGWALTEGQSLQVSQNQALFSLLGTMYGGDGRTTFNLPNLKGRLVRGKGTAGKRSSLTTRPRVTQFLVFTSFSICSNGCRTDRILSCCRSFACNVNVDANFISFWFCNFCHGWCNKVVSNYP